MLIPTTLPQADTSIDCNGAEHQRFVAFDVLLILLYQATIIGYIYILYSHREKINCLDKVDGDVAAALRMRDTDRSIDHIRFLFQATRPACWYHEIVDMYRRLLFLGVLPLMGSDPVTKAYLGATCSMATMIYFRENAPSRDGFTNVLGTVAQYQILFAFLGAIFLQTGAIEKLGISDTGLGLLLVGINLVVVGMALHAGWAAHQRDEAATRAGGARAVVAVEPAQGWGEERMRLTLEGLADAALPPTHVLAYHYTSLAAARLYAAHGVPAFAAAATAAGSAAGSRHRVYSRGRAEAGNTEELEGSVWSLRAPHEMPPGDPALALMSPLSASREAVLVAALPRAALWPLLADAPAPADGAASNGGGGGGADDQWLFEGLEGGGGVNAAGRGRLVVLPAAALAAFAGCRPDEDETWEALKHWGMTVSDVAILKRRAAEAAASQRAAAKNRDLAAASASFKAGGGGLRRFSSFKMGGGGGGGAPVPGDGLDDTPQAAAAPPPRDAFVAAEAEAAEAQRLAEQADVDGDGIPDFPPLVLPARALVRAFQLVPDALANERPPRLGELVCPEPVSDLVGLKSAWDRAPSGKRARAEAAKLDPRTRRPASVRSADEFLGRLEECRERCARRGLVPLYHYTAPFAGPLVAAEGLRAAGEGPAAGGVALSAGSPASFGLGTAAYEDALLAECFGEGRLGEHRGRHRLDVCVVYAAEPAVVRRLRPAKGGGVAKWAHHVPAPYFGSMAAAGPSLEDAVGWLGRARRAAHASRACERNKSAAPEERRPLWLS